MATGTIEGTTNEIKMNDTITFIATPNSDYGLVKYTVGNSEATYIESSKQLDADFTSPEITITDELLGNIAPDKSNTELTITLVFDKVVTVDMNMDETNSGAVGYDITTNYEGEKVAHTYDEASNSLTAFEKSTLSIAITANKIDDQYYVINKLVVGDEEFTSVNTQTTNINSAILDVSGEGKKISVTSAKVYNAEDREIKDGSTVVAVVGVVSGDDDEVYIDTNTQATETDQDDTRFIVEDSVVKFNITENNSSYDFLGVEIAQLNDNGEWVIVKILKDQLDAEDWTTSTNASNQTVHTWDDQSYTKQLSEAEPIMLEKWYTPGDNSGRTVTVTVTADVTAELVNTNTNYSYILQNNIFGSGSDPLYAGDWMVTVTDAVSKTYTVEVRVYTGATYTTYSADKAFNINSSVTKVEINITEASA